MARALWHTRPGMAEHSWRVRGAELSRGVCLRTSRGSLSGLYRECAGSGVRRDPARPSSRCRASDGEKRRAALPRRAFADRQRIQHVGEKHAVADGRHQRGDGYGRRARQGRTAGADATPHDLAWMAIADELGDRAVNVHFQDEFPGNEIVFDYKMRPGPVAHSNALALMRAVGLSGLDDPRPDLETLTGPVAEKPHMADKRQYE